MPTDPRPTSRHKILLDADVGIDDAIAMLFLAGRTDAEIVGVGSVHGNIPSELAAANARRADNAYAMRQLCIQGGHPPRRREPAARQIHMRNLPGRVDARVGAARAVQLEIIAGGDRSHRAIDLALNRPRVLLNLPAAVPRAGILDRQPESHRPVPIDGVIGSVDGPARRRAP